MDIEQRVKALRRAQEVKIIDRVRLRASQVPFCDDTIMSGPPSCSKSDFRTPRLRKCPLGPDAINWKRSSRLDGGLDGYAWKVWFGDDGPYVLKVFWDPEPPEFSHYFAAQRECQNAALFQMLETAVQEASKQGTPIRVNPDPQTRGQAIYNLRAFTDEARSRPPVTGDSDLKEISSIPRLRKCYGWLQLSGALFNAVSYKLMPPVLRVDKITRAISPDVVYYAVVYEYIDETENPHDVVEDAAKFLRLTGFSYCGSPHAKNWKGGVLLDLSDIVHPFGFGWIPMRHGLTLAESLLLA